MQDLRELYQDIILDHSKHPRNFGKLGGPLLNAHLQLIFGQAHFLLGQLAFGNIDDGNEERPGYATR